MNDRARARNTVEKALTDIDNREDASAIERFGEAAALLSDGSGDGEERLPEFEEAFENEEVA